LVDFICFRLKLLRSALWCSLKFAAPGGCHRYEIAHTADTDLLARQSALAGKLSTA